jgi:hypothetical protein
VSGADLDLFEHSLTLEIRGSDEERRRAKKYESCALCPVSSLGLGRHQSPAIFCICCVQAALSPPSRPCRAALAPSCAGTSSA